MQGTRCSPKIDNDIDKSIASVDCPFNELLFVQSFTPLNDAHPRNNVI